MRQVYKDLLEGQEEYLGHLQECLDRALEEVVEYSVKINEQEKVIIKTRREAMNFPSTKIDGDHENTNIIQQKEFCQN